MDNLAKKVHLQKKTRLETRLVNLHILRAGLMYKIYAQILPLDDIVEIRKFGGADQFKIQCLGCFCLNDGDNENGSHSNRALVSDVINFAVFLECKCSISRLRHFHLKELFSN